MCSRSSNVVGAVAEVVEQHVLRREVERPVVALRERVAVVVVRVVDPAAGIAVLPPRAADFAVLLDDHEGDAGLVQAVRGEQTGHAGPDDHARGSRSRGRRRHAPAPDGPRREYASSSSSSGRYAAISWPPTAYSMIFSSTSSVGIGAGFDRRVAVLDERVDGELARGGQLLLAQPALLHREEQRDRAAGRRAAARGHP